MQNPIKILQRMFVEGGVEIVTPGVARTFIQPDADVIHYIDRDVVSSANPEEKLRPHLDKLYEFLDSLKKVKLAFDWIFPSAAVAVWIWTGTQWVQSGELSFEIMIQFVFGFVPPFAKPGMIWVLKRFFNRKLSQNTEGVA
ncbi:MAG: hypothetical protein ACE5I1_33305 [bacterium]